MGNRTDLLDASTLLDLTSDLRDTHARIAHASVSESQRRLWKRRIGAIAESAAADLDQATTQLRRISWALDRVNA